MKQKNKITLITMLMAAASLLMQSCGKDNLKYPSSTLSGRFTYQGQPVQLRPGNQDIVGAQNTNTLLFKQTKGIQNVYGANELRVYGKNDGTFKSEFFDGEYLMRSQARVPFEVISNVPVTVSGDTNLGDIEVVPYWWMNNFVFTTTGGVVRATFNLTKPSNQTGRTLQFVAIYLSPTSLADVGSSSIGYARTYNAGTNSGGNVVPAAAASCPPPTTTGCPVDVRIDLNALVTATTTAEKDGVANLVSLGGSRTIWAVVAVKTLGVDDALYSTPVMLQLPTP